MLIEEYGYSNTQTMTHHGTAIKVISQLEPCCAQPKYYMHAGFISVQVMLRQKFPLYTRHHYLLI